jgi:metal-dependent amidase/aminoacylase/carboxypeptidase family protein
VVDGSRVHGIITDGGQAANVVPAHSAGLFYIRANEDEYLETLKERVVGCFEAGAQATGAHLEHRWSEPQYSTMKNNQVISSLYARNLERLGRKVEPYEGRNFGSTDMGNVSYMAPGIHPIIAVSPRGVSIHTEEFETHAGSEAGHSAMADGATAMAWTVIDLLAEPSNLAQAREEFLGGGG